jgi:hypothetical protein
MTYLSQSDSMIEVNRMTDFNPTQMRTLGLGCRYGMTKKLSFSLGQQYTTVFQAKVYAINACTIKNMRV